MHFVEFLWKNLSRRPVRSLLTALGIALAIATMTLLRGASMGFERSFLESLQRQGLDMVVVAAGVPDQLRSDLDERIGPKILAVDGVRAVYPVIVELIDVERGSGILSVLVHGWPPHIPALTEMKIRSGRRLGDGPQPEVMLGSKLAENLKKSSGDTVLLQGEAYSVAGIFDSPDVFENGSVVMRLAELQRLMARQGHVTGFSVEVHDRARNDTDLDRISHSIENLTNNRGGKYRVSAEPSRKYVAQIIQIRIAKGMAWFTSAVALIIGSVGMLNTMLMSVMERTREIGILRAMGWSRSRVLKMIMGEALVLTILGTILGIGLAYLGLRVLSRLPQTSGFISGDVAPRVILEGVCLTLLVVFLGGLYPAQRAAMLLPTDALRYE